MRSVAWCNRCEEYRLRDGYDCPVCDGGVEAGRPGLAVVAPGHRKGELSGGCWVEARSDGTAWVYDTAGNLVSVSGDSITPDVLQCENGHEYRAIGPARCPRCHSVDGPKSHSRTERRPRRRKTVWVVAVIAVVAALAAGLMASGSQLGDDGPSNSAAAPAPSTTETVPTETTAATTAPTVQPTTTTAASSTTTNPSTTSTTSTTVISAPEEEQAGGPLPPDAPSIAFVDAAIANVIFPVEEANTGWEDDSLTFAEAEELFEEAATTARDLSRYVTTDDELRTNQQLIDEASRLEDRLALLPDAFRHPDDGQQRRAVMSSIRSSYVSIASLADQQRAGGTGWCSPQLIAAALWVGVLTDRAADDEFRRWQDDRRPVRDHDDLADALSAAESLLWLVGDDGANQTTQRLIDSQWAATTANQQLLSGMSDEDYAQINQAIEDWNEATTSAPTEFPDEFCAEPDVGA